jgi:hypothetical protein
LKSAKTIPKNMILQVSENQLLTPSYWGAH